MRTAFTTVKLRSCRLHAVVPAASVAFGAIACNSQIVIGSDIDDSGLRDAGAPSCPVPPCDRPPPPPPPPPPRWFRDCPDLRCLQADGGGPLPPDPGPCAPEGAPCSERGLHCGVPLPSNDCSVLVCERDDPRERGCP